MEKNEKITFNNEDYIHKAKRTVGGKWIEGFPLIIDNEWYICSKNEFKHYKIIDKTLCRCTGKRDINHELIFEHDYIQSMGNGLIMEIRFGEYQAYCPVDSIWLPTIGFYAKADNYKDMPIGELPDYALKLHSKFDNRGEDDEN